MHPVFALSLLPLAVFLAGKVLSRDLGIVSVSRDVDSRTISLSIVFGENLACFRLTAFHLLFDASREF